MNKNVLKDLFLGEFSLVLKPAHEGATIDVVKSADRVVLMKAAEDGALCPGCQMSVKKGAKHCSECGSSMTTKSAPQPAPENKNMDPKDQEIADLKAKLAKSQKLSELTDVQKLHYKRLDSDEQVAFLGKSAKEREEECAPVYKAVDGTIFTKADDPRMVTMAKTADKDRADGAEKLEKAERTLLLKRAETELPHLPGTIEARASLLKAAESISDEKDRNEAVAALKAHDASMSKAFARQGVGAGAKTGEQTGPEAKLEQLAKEYAKENKVDLAKAMDEVLQTDEGADLYSQIPAPRASN